MARKESITSNMILDTAFELTRKEGAQAVSARSVAARVGCSTQPIFRGFQNMEELMKAVQERAVLYFRDYYSLYPRTSLVPFVNIGMAYISFAKLEKQLFKLLFVSEADREERIYSILEGEEGNIAYEMDMARVYGCNDPERIYHKMWWTIHGIACMSLTGDYNEADVATLQLLEEIYTDYAE